MNNQGDERAPTKHKTLVLLDNLLFAAKINQAAAQASVQTLYAKSADNALTMARAERPSLIIVDLDAANCEPLDLIRRVKVDEEIRSIPVLGFVSHVNTGLQEQARNAGCDWVMARSTLDRGLVTIFTQLS